MLKKQKYLDIKEVEKFKDFIKDFKLTHEEIAHLEGDHRTNEAIGYRLKNYKKIRRKFARDIIKAKIMESKKLIEKYKDLDF